MHQILWFAPRILWVLFCFGMYRLFRMCYIKEVASIAATSLQPLSVEDREYLLCLHGRHIYETILFLILVALVPFQWNVAWWIFALYGATIIIVFIALLFNSIKFEQEPPVPKKRPSNEEDIFKNIPTGVI